MQRFRVGGGGVDAPLSGVDRTAPDGGAPQSLVGNVYRIELGVPTAARAGISARGGAWGGVAREATDARANVALPSASESLSGTTEAIVVGPVRPTTKTRLMSAGGSSLPIDLFLVTP